MSPRQALRWLADTTAGTAFERAVRRARLEPQRDFLFGWNRGLGDIALGLVPLFARIRRDLEGARIVVVTRADLVQPFMLTDADAVHAVPNLARGEAITAAAIAAIPNIEMSRFAAMFLDPDVNRWLDGRRGDFPPRLRWDPAWDALAASVPSLPPGEFYVGAHVSAETRQFYGYAKDWEPSSWRALIAGLDLPGVRWLLFGHARDAAYAGANVLDLRGSTGFLEMAAIVRNRCRVLVAPDSGILATAYYLDARFPLDVVSLWSDPRQGVLLQGCPSPNPLLRHLPLLGRGEQASAIPVADVLAEVRAAIVRAR